MITATGLKIENTNKLIAQKYGNSLAFAIYS
jgi:hypothetical protein